jgi:hypothetical protein
VGDRLRRYREGRAGQSAEETVDQRQVGFQVRAGAVDGVQHTAGQGTTAGIRFHGGISIAGNS